MVWMSGGKQRWFCRGCNEVTVFRIEYNPTKWTCRQCGTEKDRGRR